MCLEYIMWNNYANNQNESHACKDIECDCKVYLLRLTNMIAKKSKRICIHNVSKNKSTATRDIRNDTKVYLYIFTVNQQILATIKFGVSQNKVIWRQLNLASPTSMQCTIDITYLRMLVATNTGENTKFTKYNSTPKFVDLQYEMLVRI